MQTRTEERTTTRPPAWNHLGRLVSTGRRPHRRGPVTPDFACVSVIDQSSVLGSDPPLRWSAALLGRCSLVRQSCSSGSSALRAIATRVTPSGRSINLTPIVFRSRVRRTGFTGVRITPPLDVIAKSSSSALIITAPTSPPRRCVILAVRTPLPPRPWTGYSSMGVRFAYPPSVAIRTSVSADDLHASSSSLSRRIASRSHRTWRGPSAAAPHRSRLNRSPAPSC